MSPLSRNRLLASIGPARASWVRVAGSLRPRVVAKRSVTVPSDASDVLWHRPLAALAGELDALSSDALDVSVVLSNHFVRYVLVPPAAGATSRDEELALARHHFARIYGELAKNWDMRIAPGRRDAPRLACAADAGLIGGLKACLPSAGRHRLVSVQPYLMAAFNIAREKVRGEGTWMLLVEEARVCIGLYCRGMWETIHNVAGRFALPEDWVALLERERLRAAGNTLPRTALVRTDDRADLQRHFGGRWHLASLDPCPIAGYMPAEDGPYAMGLCAL